MVINKCDDGSDNLGLDERRLMQEDSGIVAFVRTCCDPGEAAEQSIAALRQVIANTLDSHKGLEWRLHAKEDRRTRASRDNSSCISGRGLTWINGDARYRATAVRDHGLVRV